MCLELLLGIRRGIWSVVFTNIKMQSYFCLSTSCYQKHQEFEKIAQETVHCEERTPQSCKEIHSFVEKYIFVSVRLYKVGHIWEILRLRSINIINLSSNLRICFLQHDPNSSKFTLSKGWNTFLCKDQYLYISSMFFYVVICYISSLWEKIFSFYTWCLVPVWW